MKLLAALTMTLMGGTAMAADYSVSIATNAVDNYGTPVGGINLYSITHKGVHLVQGSPYVLQPTDVDGHWQAINNLAINTSHDFVYATYIGGGCPYIAGFQITPKGLVRKFLTNTPCGDDRYTGLTASENYASVYLLPNGLYGFLISETGVQIGFFGGFYADQFLSLKVNSSGFFYACRNTSTLDGTVATTADKVVAYDLKNTSTTGTPPRVYQVPSLVFTSVDPLFVQSICN